MGRLESCRHFNAEEFIKNLKKWRAEKKKLLKKLDAISELPSIDNKSGIRGTTVSNPTLNLAERREQILADIKDIEKCEKMYEYAKSKLTDEEKKILEGFFENKKPVWQFVQYWQETRYVGSTKVYQERDRVLKKIEKIIGGG